MQEQEQPSVEESAAQDEEESEDDDDDSEETSSDADSIDLSNYFTRDEVTQLMAAEIAKLSSSLNS